MSPRSLSLATVVVLGCLTIIAVTAAGNPRSPVQKTGGADQARRSGGCAALQGRVIGADNRQPIAGATVSARAPGAPTSTASTDSNGRFEFTSLPPALYTLTASKAAFLDGRAGASEPQGAGIPVECPAGQAVTAPEIRLWPGGVIMGIVSEPSGEPAIDCQVVPLRARYVRGQRRLVAAGPPVLTDDTGTFRLFGLVPASYYLVAIPRRKPSAPGAGSRVVTVASYYPGGAEAGNAEPVPVAAGSSVPVALTLASAPDVRIAGIVLDRDEAPVKGGTLSVVPADGGMARPVTIASNGEFEVRGVAPGAYVLESSRPKPGGRGGVEISRVAVAVGAVDVIGVAVRAIEPARLYGRIVGNRDDLKELTPAAIYVALSSAGVLTTTLQPVAHVADDLTFSAQAWPGPVLLGAIVTSPGWMMRAVRLDGRDVTDEGVACESEQEVRGLEIEVTKRAASVSGVVVARDGKRVGTADVLVFPQDRTRYSGFRYIKLVAVDSNGEFAGCMLLPGTYYAVAFAHVPPDDWMSAAFLDRAQPLAVKFSLAEGEAGTLQLTRRDTPPW